MDGGEPEEVRGALMGDLRRSGAGSGRHRDDGGVPPEVASRTDDPDPHDRSSATIKMNSTRILSARTQPIREAKGRPGHPADRFVGERVETKRGGKENP